jgi:hypothetical protein
MKNLILGFVIILAALSQNFAQKTAERQQVNLDKYCGTYEYINPHNTPDLTENNYIVLSKVDKQLTGLYYGTSDEFDQAREMYLPGFFVALMKNVLVSGDSIYFTLYVENKDFFEKPIDLKYKTANDARINGYKKWKQSLDFEPKNYIGIFNKEGIIFKQIPDDKVFKLKK